MNWLNYHHLYYFYMIAKEQGVTEASHKLKLAQSTLSMQLKQFEENIGYKLFERKRKKLFLTDVGKRVFNYAHEIFSLGDELKSTLSQLESSYASSLKIGIMDSVPKKICRKLLTQLNRNHQARLTVHEESLSSLSSRLAAHQIDLIIANDKPLTTGEYSRFHAKLIGEMDVVFIAHPDFIDLRKDIPRSLNNQPIIMPGVSSPLQHELIEHFKIKHIQPRFIAEVDDLELQKALVIDKHGVGALPVIAVEDELKSGKLVRLSETPICHENLWIITTHRLVHHPMAKDLIENFRPTLSS